MVSLASFLGDKTGHHTPVPHILSSRVQVASGAGALGMGATPIQPP
jgi:hypothetical protein